MRVTEADCFFYVGADGRRLVSVGRSMGDDGLNRPLMIEILEMTRNGLVVSSVDKLAGEWSDKIE